MKKTTEETYYFATYKDNSTPVAISNVKGLVKEYMETHRYVDPKDYTITEKRSTPGEIQLDYPYAIVEEYENWYIPSVDIEMIEVNKHKIEDIVEDTIQNLKLIYLFTDGIKQTEKGRTQIIRMMQTLYDFKKKKKVWNKIVDNYTLSDLLFLDRENYWNSRCMYIDMKETRQRWDFMIENKGGDKMEEF